MKKIPFILSLLLVVGCSGGGGGGGGSGGTTEPPTDVSAVAEGTGPALDVSNSSEVRFAVLKTIKMAEDGFSRVDQDQSSEVSKGISPEKSSNSPSEELVKLCKDGQVTKDYTNVVVAGSSGKATINGKAFMKKTSDDGASGDINLSAVLDNFSTSVYVSPTGNLGAFTMNGSVVKETKTTITKGMKGLCDTVARVETSPSASDSSYNQTSKDHITGALSLSGGVAAAITFDYSNEFTISNDGQFSFAVSGNATFKSGGKQISCTITRDGTVEDSSTQVSCK